MRFTGKLKKWNSDRGFGFIAADQGGDDLFVHISALPRGAHAPTEGLELSFEVELGRDGRKRAVRVQIRTGGRRLGVGKSDRPPARPRTTARRPQGVTRGLVTLCLAAAIGWLGYTHYVGRLAREPANLESVSSVPLPVAMVEGTAFRCDGRRYCSQMKSCKEAKYFLKNCPRAAMDGDHNGVPCEQQWCTSPWAD